MMSGIPWLTAIAVNVCRLRLRKRKMRHPERHLISVDRSHWQRATRAAGKGGVMGGALAVVSPNRHAAAREAGPEVHEALMAGRS